MPHERDNPLEQLSLEELHHRTSQKWRAHGSDLLPLWVAEMDVPLAPPVADALRHAIDIGDTGYAPRPGMPRPSQASPPHDGTGPTSQSPIPGCFPT